MDEGQRKEYIVELKDADGVVKHVGKYLAWGPNDLLVEVSSTVFLGYYNASSVHFKEVE